MITFVIGKIPGEVMEVTYSGNVLPLSEALKLGSEKVGFSYNDTDIVHINGIAVTTREVSVQNGDIILVDTPKIKGAQILVTVSRKGGIVKKLCLHTDATIGQAIGAAGLELTSTEVIYVNGIITRDSAQVGDGNNIVVAEASKVISGNVDIYAAINDLQNQVDKIKYYLDMESV